MKRILSKGFEKYEFLNWRDVRYMEFRNRFDALAFLRSFLDDRGAMAFFRRLLGRESAFSTVPSLTDDQVLEELAVHLVTNNIRVLRRFERFYSDIQIAGYMQPGEAEAAPEAAEGEETEQEEEEQEQEPVPEELVEAQAEALKEAASSGAPICQA